MINIPCGKCGSMNIGKNGTAAAGASEISLQSLRFLRDTRYSGRKTEEKRGACGEASERTRSAVRDRACGPRQPRQGDISYKKRNPGCRIGSCEDGGTSYCRNGAVRSTDPVGS